MMLGDRFFPDDPGERYSAARWDRAREDFFRPEHHPPYLRRIWNRRLNAYGKGEHATQVWTRWLGRVWISR